MKILGIIPARGGSKGVPDKNVRFLGDLPLIAYTILAARQSSLHTVIVSSDDEKIIQVAREYDAEIPFIRPASLATDRATTLSVVQHALSYYREKNISFDAVCILQPTTPFREEGLIDACFKKFIETNADTLFTAISVPHHFNPHWVFEEGKEGLLKLSTGEEQIIPSRQLLPKAYIRDGSVYLIKTNVITQNNSLYGEKISFMETNSENYINIDTEADWQKAENMIEILP